MSTISRANIDYNGMSNYLALRSASGSMDLSGLQDSLEDIVRSLCMNLMQHKR